MWSLDKQEGFPHSEICDYNASSQLIAAYHRLACPSSASCVKASTIRPWLLFRLFLKLTFLLKTYSVVKELLTVLAVRYQGSSNWTLITTAIFSFLWSLWESNPRPLHCKWSVLASWTKAPWSIFNYQCTNLTFYKYQSIYFKMTTDNYKLLTSGRPTWTRTMDLTLIRGAL